jgi:hypothetical protein
MVIGITGTVMVIVIGIVVTVTDTITEAIGTVLRGGFSARVLPLEPGLQQHHLVVAIVLRRVGPVQGTGEQVAPTTMAACDTKAADNTAG